MKTSLDYKKEVVRKFAEKAKEAGLSAYIAESGTHGFITNGKRVISFQEDFYVIKAGGTYAPSSQSGTGWGIGNFDPDKAINFGDLIESSAPFWANQNPVYTTEKEYLKTYNSSSKFTKI
jgi:hypothetical protein